MWLEMPTPPEALKNKPKVLNAPLAMDVELRVVVWSVRELVIHGKPRPPQPALQPYVICPATLCGHPRQAAPPLTLALTITVTETSGYPRLPVTEPLP